MESLQNISKSVIAERTSNDLWLGKFLFDIQGELLMQIPLKWPVILLAVASLAGCFASEDSRFADLLRVNGTVTFDGQPLANGAIQFTSPEDRMRGTATSVAIVDGRFETRLSPGKKDVTVNSFQLSGPKDETGVQQTIELIPPKYNAKSTLTVEVTQETTMLDFELTN